MTNDQSSNSNSWDSFWLRSVPPHALAFTRIAFGLFLLLYAGLYIPHLNVLFSNEGLVLPLYIDRFPQLSFLLSPQSPLFTHLLYFFYCLCMVGITIGLFFRTSTLLTILLSLYYWQLQLHLFPTSYNRILLLCLLVFLCSGAQRTFSLDQKRRTGSFFHWQPISILPQRLITLQVTVTFLGVSLQKLWLPHWKGGEVLAYSFISRWSSPVGRWYARLPLTIHHYDMVVWMVKIFQPCIAIGLWIPRVRIPCILLIWLFLILVSVMMTIWWFIFIIPACILFFRPEDVHTWLAKRYPQEIGLKSVKHTK